MIIDFHRHVWSALERYPQVREIAGRSARPHITIDSTPGDYPDGYGRRGETIIADMDEAGVDLSVVFLGDYGLRLGEGPVSVTEENERHVELAWRHPDRLVCLLGVDPRRDEAADLFRRGLDEWGVRGLKLHPGSGFSPSDPECFPLYELAGAWGVPVAIHTGPIASPLLSAGGQPLLMDEAAARYPDTTFVMLHAGQDCWWREALQIAFWKPNVFLELSGWHWMYLRDRREFFRALGAMTATLGSQRIIFGSDMPVLNSAMPLSAWVSVFNRLSAEAEEHDVHLGAGDVANMLGRNAAKLLNLVT